MATIKDVANDAGVAVGTVSKVLNGHHVSAENKRKVEESVARLGYQMNYYARGLKTRYTYTVAVQELTARGSRKLLFIRSGSCLSSETLNRGAYLLSSIAQPVEDMACAAVESVIHLIRREPVKEMTVLPVTFVEGGTTRIME